MEDLKYYRTIVEKYPLLSMKVRNSFMSEVTKSKHRLQDKKDVLEALSKFKKKKTRLKIIEKYMLIKCEVNTMEDVVPSINKFFKEVQKIVKK